MTSAFIIDVQPQLQQDPNEETAALLRVLIHKLDNTTFGGGVPPVPQWSGPSHTIVQVQAMLYASLAASLLSAFLAMLGKQWLNRYASIDMRGTAVERSQNRQRKLNGIIVWYFDHIMESLPLMLQFALLLLGCALSCYIWEINTTVASVLIGVTSFGVICYAFILVAGTASVSCPYQTPGAQILRYLWQKASDYSKFFAIKGSTIQRPGAHLGPEQELDREATGLNFHCILWMLQTSLDRRVILSALRSLELVVELPGFKTAIAVECFNILVGCISVSNEGRVVVLRGSEELAESVTTCLLGGLSHLVIMDPASKVLEEMRQRFRRLFPSMTDLQDLPFNHTLRAVTGLLYRHDYHENLGWKVGKSSTLENIVLVNSVVRVVWSRYQVPDDWMEAPHWGSCSRFDYLLQDPQLPASVIAHCLSIVAIELGCDVPESDVETQDKRYARLPNGMAPFLTTC